MACYFVIFPLEQHLPERGIVQTNTLKMRSFFRLRPFPSLLEPPQIFWFLGLWVSPPCDENINSIDRGSQLIDPDEASAPPAPPVSIFTFFVDRPNKNQTL